MRGWVGLTAAAAFRLSLAGSANAAPAPPDMTVPFSFEITELFKIQDGKIMRVEAVLNTVPYGSKSGW